MGVSTHTAEQVRAANLTSADYIAFGPIFTTGSKADHEPVVGLAGLRAARALTDKPLVAIGGFTPGILRRGIGPVVQAVAVMAAFRVDPAMAGAA